MPPPPSLSMHDTPAHTATKEKCGYTLDLTCLSRAKIERKGIGTSIHDIHACLIECVTRMYYVRLNLLDLLGINRFQDR